MTHLPLSAVLITKNEAEVIATTIKALLLLTDDVVVVDSNSTDKTVQIAQDLGARVFVQDWLGYGPQKNFANSKAKYDWILSIDADEVIENELVDAINDLFSKTVQENEVFKIKRRTVYEGKLLKYGSLINEKHIRFFNRKSAKWSDGDVHETLDLADNVVQKMIPNGAILHYSYRNLGEHEGKIDNYTNLYAKKAFKKGKKVNFVKLYLSAPFKFVKDYFFRFGFLDGKLGLKVARLNFRYDWLKYRKLRSLYLNQSLK